jgi:molybdopterin-guanine dinucleotide biosynthesis protein A
VPAGLEIARADITGLVLAGGRGRRMGGVDKGLQTLAGQPMALRALRRLSPQVGATLVNANRHLADYQAFGVPVVVDAVADFAGPLAGFQAGLQRAATSYMMTVPCDCPHFPVELVQRLADALRAGQAEVAVACTRDPLGAVQRHPVFCLLPVRLAGDLTAFLAAGGRRVDAWLSRLACADVVFPVADDFINLNSPADLGRIAL